MRRRELLLLIGAVALLPGVSRGEQQRRIGFLGLTSKAAWANSADFRQGLAETGYIEGRNLVIDYRWAEGHYDRLLALAAELVSEKAEAISTEGGPAPAKAAMQATTTIPIVGSTVASLVKHFNRPEGNLTGVSIVTGDLMLKRLQILTRRQDRRPDEPGLYVLRSRPQKDRGRRGSARRQARCRQPLRRCRFRSGLRQP